MTKSIWTGWQVYRLAATRPGRQQPQQQQPPPSSSSSLSLLTSSSPASASPSTLSRLQVVVGVVIVVAGPHSLCCCHHPCLHHRGSQCSFATAATATALSRWSVVVSPTQSSAAVVCRSIRHLPSLVIVQSSTLLPPVGAGALYRQPSSPTAVLSLLSRPSIAFATPVDGWLLRYPPVQQHTN